MSPQSSALGEDLQRIVDARHYDPFSVLGRQQSGGKTVVRAFLPGAVEARLPDIDAALSRVGETALLEWHGDGSQLPAHHRLEWTDDHGDTHTVVDPYTFAPQLSDFDLHLFGEGRHWHAYRFLGAHPTSVDGVTGTLFAVWAPNAERVSVVGDFNGWDGRRHPMRIHSGSGVWELFIPHLQPGDLYKFELRNRDSGAVVTKADPYARQSELRPATSSVVAGDSDYAWGDGDWMAARPEWDWQHAPFSVYEVHLGSWQLDDNGEFLGYRELAHRLGDYVAGLGYTHIELMPITEHPLDASWGYQTVGFFAPTSRFGSPDDFRYFVDHLHQRGIGVLLDWVPGHFPKDAHGLARFDGSALYEHSDPRLGEHRDWGTLIFNFARHEVHNFLLSSALYWLEEFHLDGLRVDAVASMLYLNYSREEGDWVPNKYGGNENLEAIEFLQHMNEVTHSQQPGTLVIAEESTSWPAVTRPPYLGGLGFSMKWNMGWMHDTLEYFKRDPIHRHYHHDHLTFGLLYAFTENFVLPFSHDEIVHGKGSLLDKMPGDDWQRFANLRLLYTFMFTYPGKQLLFMGNEFAQGREWSEERALDWHLTDYPGHNGLQTLIGDLNRAHRDEPPLHRYDFDAKGFEWVDCHDAAQSVLSYLRWADGEFVLGLFNFTPVPRHDYRIGVPEPGVYSELINSDSEFYGGSNVGNFPELVAESEPWMGRSYSLRLTLPPLAGLVLKRTGEA
jgi:1,4-alpha-glucan branching enzyme